MGTALAVAIVSRYLEAAGGFDEPEVRWPAAWPGDPLYAVVGRRTS